jgi:hypothetical protein
MKNYKIVFTDGEVLKKLDRLNIEFKDRLNAPISWLIIVEGDNFYKVGFEEWNNSEFPQMLQADFLALPEPFKIGDWVKLKTDKGTVIFKIKDLSGRSAFSCLLSSDIRLGGNIEHCSKLTTNQIEILELES